MGQCDCHNYKCDLSADREHGERVKLETHRQAEGEGLEETNEDTHAHTQSTPP